MPNPNITDSALEAGGKVYGRAAVTDKFSSLVEVDSSGYVTVGSGLTGLKSAGGHVALATVAGARVVGGITALDGSNATDVVTGLTTVTGFSAIIAGSSAPGDGTSVLTYAISGGTVSLYAWKNTSGNDPTLVASTGTENVAWIAYGT